MESPVFIYEERDANQIFDYWLGIIDRIEASTITDGEDDTAIYNSQTIGYTLFPLIDSISFNLFGSGMRRYLRELNYSRNEANIITLMFRNGMLHNTRAKRLKFRNTEVSWSLLSSNGNGGFFAFDEGYVDSENHEFDMPAERPLEIIPLANHEYNVMLSVDRLTAQVRHDLLRRKREFAEPTMNFIVGEEIDSDFRP